MKRHIRFFKAIVVLAVISFSAFVSAEETGPDQYENDNYLKNGKVIVLNDKTPQKHSFYETNDEDWVKFFGLRDETYEVKAENVGKNCSVVIELYDKNENLLNYEDTGTEGDDALFTFSTPEDDIYYIKISNISELQGSDTGYDLSLNRPKAAVVAMFQGSATDAISKAPLGDVMIRTDQSVTALSDENAEGNYAIYHPISPDFSKPYTLTARLPGYEIFTIPVFTSVSCSGGKSCFKTYAESGGAGQRTDPEPVEWDGVIELIPLKGDINGDLKADLADAVLGLQIVAGIESEKIRLDYIQSRTDVNEDNKVGMEEVLHILNKIGTLKTDA